LYSGWHALGDQKRIRGDTKMPGEKGAVKRTLRGAKKKKRGVQDAHFLKVARFIQVVHRGIN